MFGHREMGMEDYLTMLRRRIWWILAPIVVAPLIGLGISFALPNQYTSRTLVLVEQQKVPQKYVNTGMTDDLAERLATMQEQVMSRTRLQPIIERFGLYKKDVGKVPMEDLVDRMRKDIGVSAIKADFAARGGQGLPGFVIRFTADNPRVAQQVCAEITSMFMAENLKAREQSAQGTTEFLAKQLDDAKRKLDDLDSKLAEYKQKHLGALPGQEQTNMTVLMTLNTQLDGITQALNRALQDKTYAESMLSQQLEAWQSGDVSGGAGQQSLEQQLAAAQANLNVLETRYTADHPDVVKAHQTVDDLRKKIEAVNDRPKVADNKDRKKPAFEPKSIQQIRGTLHALDNEIALRKHQQEMLQAKINDYQGKVAQAPMVEEEGKALTRDYTTALAFYNELLTKKTQSEMATDMERRQQGENFRVMDPANLPEKPSFPDRTMFTIGGLLAGLGLGFGMAFLMELRDKSLRTDQDIEFYLELQTLAMVPVVDANSSHNGNRPRWWQRKKSGKPDEALIEQGAEA